MDKSKAIKAAYIVLYIIGCTVIMIALNSIFDFHPAYNWLLGMVMGGVLGKYIIK